MGGEAVKCIEIEAGGSTSYLAYTSTVSGRDEVYLAPYPACEPRWQVSTEGGHFPEWRADGRELFFTTHTELWSASVDTRNGVDIGLPRVLFRRPSMNWA